MVAALFTIRIYHKMQQTKQCTLRLAILQLSLLNQWTKSCKPNSSSIFVNSFWDNCFYKIAWVYASYATSKKSRRWRIWEVQRYLEWSFKDGIFQTLIQTLGEASIELFASRINKKGEGTVLLLLMQIYVGMMRTVTWTVYCFSPNCKK